MFRTLSFVVIFSAANLLGCSFLGLHSRSQVAKEPHFEHTVRYRGETLGLIASWYAGKESQWPKIASINPNIDVKNLRLGDRIKIPQSIAKRTTSFTHGYIQGRKYTKRSEGAVSQKDPVTGGREPSIGAIASGQLENGEQNPDEELFNAVAVGDLARVTEALEKGADKNFIYNNRSVLGWAAQNKSPEILQILIKSGADLNHIDGIAHSPLMRAVDAKQLANLKLLLEAKPALEHRTARGETALHLAIKNNDADAVRALIESGADVNAVTTEGDTTVLTALLYNHADLIPILADANAKVNAANSVYTPLQYAVSQNNPAMVATLLKAGANPNMKGPDGRLPIFQAVNKPEILKMLIDAKAEVNVTGPYNETPLNLAIQGDALEPVQILVEAGAALNIRDYAGTSVLGTAIMQNKTEMVEYLQAKGAVE